MLSSVLGAGTFGTSVTCYRYRRKLSAENLLIEDWLLRLGAISFDAVKHLVLCQVERRPRAA